MGGKSKSTFALGFDFGYAQHLLQHQVNFARSHTPHERAVAARIRMIRYTGVVTRIEKILGELKASEAGS